MIPHSALSVYRATTNITTGPRASDRISQSKIDLLEAKLERAHLVLQTLLMILLEKKLIHEDEFREWMVYVDELDGVRDGKVREETSPQECPNCGRKSPQMSTKCIYCGTEFPMEFLARRPQPPPNP